jgi:transglutaminase-like putative cysteine protease
MPEATPAAPTPFERYFEVSLLLLVATGFVTLASTGGLDTVSVLSVSAALLLRGYAIARQKSWRIPEPWTSYLTVAYLFFYIADFFFLSASFVTATVHLVLFSMVVKIFSVQRDRDHVYLIILSFLAVLAASVLTVDSIFLGAFAVFAFLAVTTFISLEMKRSAAAASNRARPLSLSTRRMAAVLSSTGLSLVLAILVGMAAIFFLLPRVSAGYLRALAPRNQLVSGFSENVRLGEIGEIKQLSTVVMHVEFLAGMPESFDMKWRGLALSLFDGKRWFNPSQLVEMVDAPDGRFDLRPLYARRRREIGEVQAPRMPRLVRYRVLMEPIGTNVVFLAPTANFLSGHFREISMDRGGAVFANDRERMISRYEAVSDISTPAAAALRGASATASPQIAIFYLQLPKLDARVRRLAEQVTASAVDDYEKAASIETHLKSNYGYTLQLLKTPSPDPLAHFLFERKQGHCEYFASAMAVMLRSLGIPSRVVNGFRGGEFNDLTGSYIIRASDAHSWVEAYFPGQGWVSFDPTPPDPLAARTGLSRFFLYVDAMREWWREWVINYDYLHQRKLSYSAASRGREFFDQGRLWLRNHYEQLLARAAKVQDNVGRTPRRWAGPALGAIVFVLLLANAGKLRRSLLSMRAARRPERAPQQAASVWYERMTRLLARRGWRKSPQQTPAEFLATIADPDLQTSVARFTQHYERARFGDSVEDARALPQLFELLRNP